MKLFLFLLLVQKSGLLRQPDPQGSAAEGQVRLSSAAVLPGGVFRGADGVRERRQRGEPRRCLHGV